VNIPVINGLEEGWELQLETSAEFGKNFVLLLRDTVRDLLRVCSFLGEQRLPDKLERWGIYGLHDVVDHEPFRFLLSKYLDHDVFLVEQLFLNRNKPPRRKPYLVYCEVRGILSEHDTEDDGLDSLRVSAEQFTRMRDLPLSGLYWWHQDHWHKLT